MNERLLVLADIKIQLSERRIDEATLLSLYDLEMNHPNKDDFTMVGFIMDSLFEVDNHTVDVDLFINTLVSKVCNITEINSDICYKLFEIKVYKYDRTIDNYNFLYENINKIKQIDVKSKVLSALLEIYISQNDTENIKKFSNELRSLFR